MLLKHALAEYLLEIEIRKYTPKTIRSYRNNLNLFVRYLTEEAEIDEVEELTLAAVRRFSLYMVERGKKGTYINGLLKTAKSFIQYCYEEGYGGFNTKKNFRWCKEEKPVITAFQTVHVRLMLVNHLMQQRCYHALNVPAQSSCANVDFMGAAQFGNPGIFPEGEVAVCLRR